MVDAIEKKLGDNMWLGGQAPGAADREEFEKLGKVPNANSHPNTFAWYCLVSKFTDAAKAGWTGGAAAGKADAGQEAKGGKAAKGKGKGKGKKEEPKKKVEEELDEDDLFGDDDEEDVSYQLP